MNAVYIEITDACNLNCSFCPCGKVISKTAEKVKPPRQFMSAELFERCISQASSVADNVYFHVLGEPTLHPDFDAFLKKLEQTPLKLNLTTNGTTIAKISQSLLECSAVRQVNFSTHAYAELPQEQALPHLQEILHFCKMANTMRPDLYINLRLWNVGDESSNSWNKAMLAKVNEAFASSITNDTAPQISLEHFCSRHKSFNVTGRIYLHRDSRFEWTRLDERLGSAGSPTETDEKIVTGTCRALGTHVAILHDGRVVACCLDYSGQITLGNIADRSLVEILGTPLARELRKGFEKHELRHPFCQSCTFCKRFGK